MSAVGGSDSSGPEASRALGRVALIAGTGLLVMAALAVFANLFVLETLVTPGAAVRTASDIQDARGLFQVGIVAWILIAALDVLVAWALLRFFERVNNRLSWVAAGARVIYAIVLGAAIIQLSTALSVLNKPEVTLSRISSFEDIWDAGLLLFGVHLVLVGYLAYRSGYVPKWLAALIGIAGVSYVFDSSAVVLSLDPPFKAAAVAGLGEFVLAFWLVSRGRLITLDDMTLSDGSTRTENHQVDPGLVVQV